MKRSTEERRALVQAWKQSGESRKQFAARIKVHLQTLTWWARALDREMPRFAEVVHRPDPGAELVVEVGPLRIRVPRGFDANELRRLMAALC
jgi:transposase-like protein